MRATGYFLLGVCFANIIGGPVGAALMRMDGLLTMALGLGIASVSGPFFSLLGFCLSAVMLLVVAALAALRLRQGQEASQTSSDVGNPQASTR
ncbi:hypothetical protein BLL36_04170 [Pseudomonas cedrina subsp. cedrina]|uniref:MFS transporter n=1 Tax=Pseudomonas cedrina subsp. cedrina TaxID=76762 RepID=A0A1V2KHM2_PSECE|nr:hypothetical protein BLL36_04170 [Pseudomonas cedrina subsp. cedrina]